MKKTIFSVLLGGLVALVLTTPVLAATTVSLSPTSINVVEGQNFNLTVKLDPQSVKNYTTKVELTYPTDLLRVNSFTFGNSWMPVSQPGYDMIDNTNGILLKTAGYPGGIASQATFGTISFFAKKTGSGTIKLGENSLALDANNQNLLSPILTQASFAITQPASIPVEEVTPEETTPEETEIEIPAEEGIETPEEETAQEVASQDNNFLANLSVAWGGVGQMTILIIIVSLCLITLVFIGLKEWKSIQRKRRL